MAPNSMDSEGSAAHRNPHGDNHSGRYRRRGTGTDREVTVVRAPHTRVLVIPESVNPGWIAHSTDGATLTPIIVNGWQQGWVVPAGEQRFHRDHFPVQHALPSRTRGRVVLAPGTPGTGAGAARRRGSDRGARPDHGLHVCWGPSDCCWPAGSSRGWLVSSCSAAQCWPGSCCATANSVRDRLTLGVTSVGLILAGALLSRYPWRSVDGYIGHSSWVQLLALIAVGALVVSALPSAPAVPSTETPADE